MDLKRLLLQTGYPQGTINFNHVNINDVHFILLPNIGLHSYHITKDLKCYDDRFYYFVNVKVIFPNNRRMKIFLSIQGPSQPSTIIQGHL